ASLSYYNYPGSLTTPTPDCEENVNWLVLASPVEVAAADIAKFGALFQNNARPPMPIGSRAVQRSS
ncbi:MAG TPA: carbonic anhydrase family protein, partial [Roseiflexaceae bacterium]|nr:carbonic anhydrase family protein [Roseiflexaceae bacterium]